MKNRKTKQKAAVLTVIAVCASVGLSTKKTYADELYQGGVTAGGNSPQDKLIDMAKNALESFLSDQAKSYLFPEQGVDYDRIKRDMEQVVQKQILDNEIIKTIGYINGATANAATAVERRDAVEALDNIRMGLVRDISVLATGPFKQPAMGNYVQGAQTEASILAAMKAKSPKDAPFLLANGEACDRQCVINMTKTRLDAHMNHVTTTAKEISQTLQDARASQVSRCEADDETVTDWYTGRYRVIHHGDHYYDYTTGSWSQHYKDGSCNAVRNQYVDNRKYEVRKKAEADLKWAMMIRASWTGDLVALQPNLSAQEKRDLMLKGYQDTAYYTDSSCGSLVADAIKRNPQYDTCYVMKDATKVYSKYCGEDSKLIVKLVGCGDVQ